MRRDDDRITELLSAYIDGEVSDLECSEAERLLREDPEAAALYERLKAATGLLNGLGKVEAPPSLQHGVLLHLKPGKQTGFAARLRKMMQPTMAPMPLLTYAAVIIIIVALGYFATTLLYREVPAEPAGEQMADAEKRDTAKAKEEKSEAEEYAMAEAPDTAEGAVDEDAAEETQAGADTTAANTETYADAVEEEPAPAEPVRPSAATPSRSDLLLSRRSTEITRERTAAEPSLFVADQQAVEEVLDGESEDDFAAEFYVSETVTYIAERGTPMRLDYSAPPGSDANPLTDPSTFLPPRFMEFEFIGRGDTGSRGELSVFVETHVARDGSIIYLRMVGQRSSKQLIEDLADRLMATRLIPARGEQDWVSVFYSFVAVVKPAN